ncbi:MAG: resolvase [Novosphingobium sp.]|nr:resolvase [Novosphingobium sp.]
MKGIRCAIYTRKSSEEGLEQDFNSLHAQREACAAYVLSQASEGWTLNADEYDDGGISGGTLERPALQRLLADVAAGAVDIIVVYKVELCQPCYAAGVPRAAGCRGDPRWRAARNLGYCDAAGARVSGELGGAGAVAPLRMAHCGALLRLSWAITCCMRSDMPHRAPCKPKAITQ